MAIQVRERPEVESETRGMAEWNSLYQAYNAIFKVTEIALLPHNLSLPQLHVLSVLKRDGGILTTGAIGREMVKASQTITGLVDRLEAQGLVERQFDRRDRRKTWVRLTTKGERKWSEARPVANRLAEEIFSGLTNKELGDLGFKLDKLRPVAMKRLGEALGRQAF
jgi:MarR family 2-MHQ and catechol resistance regulon transcriptional repressor